MSAPANALLYRARLARGWYSQETAAEGVSVAGQDALRDPRFDVSVRTYRRWESDAPGWPRPEYATAIRAAFGRGAEQLGFTPPSTTLFDNMGVGVEIIQPVKRRDALAAGAALVGLPWMSRAAAAPDGIRIGREEIDNLQATAADLDAIDQRWGGDRLWRSARSHLMWVHHLIDSASYSEPIGQELHAIAGQLTTSLGWFCYDAERQTEARVYFSEALNAATMTGDDALATRTLSNMARQAVDLGKGREAVRFARTAQARTCQWGAPPRVTALLSIRAAQGYARGADELNASLSIKKAWKAFELGTTDTDPDWTFFLNEAELTCLEGMCRSDLGQYRQAVRLLDRSAALQDIEHSRNRGMCLTRLSHAAAQDRDLDRTIDAARESMRLIDSGMTSTRTKRQLTAVRDHLTAYPRNPAAREAVQMLSQHIA
ncbi:hypothetical protein [Streptacidiphilus sp. EB129]|uniref:hypothetical protein n=1 Tax=Streptacidiphilus sp. EB129 TaxID=3156262 RepID=UPI00351764F5